MDRNSHTTLNVILVWFHFRLPLSKAPLGLEFVSACLKRIVKAGAGELINRGNQVGSGVNVTVTTNRV